jgi:hypothetical protein
VGYDAQSERKDLKKQNEKTHRLGSKGDTWSMVKTGG